MHSYRLTWDIEDYIYNKNGKNIAIVKHIPEGFKMVLKYGDNIESELENILNYGKIFVNSPYHNLHSINKRNYWDDNWFIMNLFDCSLLEDMKYGMNHIDTLICDMIDAVKALHCNKVPIAHMDIKLDNILIDKIEKRFILSDYEMLEPVGDGLRLCSEEPDVLLYYLGRGVRASDTIISFKTDLICLGMVLWRVCRNIGQLELEEECEILRKKVKKECDLRTEDLDKILELQYELYSKIPEELKEYYGMVFNMKYSTEPQAEEYYEELKKCLLRGFNK